MEVVVCCWAVVKEIDCLHATGQSLSFLLSIIGLVTGVSQSEITHMSLNFKLYCFCVRLRFLDDYFIWLVIYLFFSLLIYGFHFFFTKFNVHRFLRVEIIETNKVNQP